MKKTITIILLLVIFSLGCTTGNVTHQEKIYKIGIVAPTSGHFAFYGEKTIQGMNLAAENFPEFEIIIEDDAGDLTQATKAAMKLITIDKVDALMTVRSSQSAAIAEKAQENQIILLYSSTVDHPAENNLYAFKNFINIENDCKELANKLQNKKGSLLGLNLDSTQTCLSSFIKEGFNIQSEFYNKEERDFRTSLTKIKENNPDFLILRADKKSLPLILRQMEELNIKNIQLVCPHITGGGCNEQKTIEEFPEYFKLALGSDIYTVKTTKIKEFDNNFKLKFNSEPIDLTYSTYENSMILFSSIKECKGDKICTLIKLSSREFEGLDGNLKFNDKGIIKRNSNIMQFNGIEWNQI